MLKLSFCDCCDEDIFAKSRVINVGVERDSAWTTAQKAILTAANKIDKRVIFKNFRPLEYCVKEINNTQVGNAKDLDTVM